jgi:predicted transcriptional regulator
MAGCGCKKGLNDDQKKILAAMAECKEPCACKDIAAATGLESKSVSCKLTALKKKGYISSPVRCKYEITDEGRSAK